MFLNTEMGSLLLPSFLDFLENVQSDNFLKGSLYTQ